MNKKSMVFISDYMNHHQLPMALAMNERYDYNFIATERISQKRLNLKYEDMNNKYDFIIRSYEGDNQQKIKDVVNNADVVIFGSCPFDLVKDRIEANKLTFKYSERLFKNKVLIRKFYPPKLKEYYNQCTKYKNHNYYLLCASAYAAKDYAWYGAFKNKTFKWGYFPNVEILNSQQIIEKKNLNEKIKLVWCNRLIPYKHPELIIDAAEHLKKNNINFEIRVIGVGELKEKIEQKVNSKELNDCVKILGSMPTEQVREELKNANISLLTADRGEGWGAVVNESMNSCCAVLCNKMIGSVPFLVKDNENGLIYKNKKEFLNKLLKLAKDKDLMAHLGKNAYETIVNVWNPENAVQQFDHLITELDNNTNNFVLDGPCSRC